MGRNPSAPKRRYAHSVWQTAIYFVLIDNTVYAACDDNPGEPWERQTLTHNKAWFDKRVDKGTLIEVPEDALPEQLPRFDHGT